MEIIESKLVINDVVFKKHEDPEDEVNRHKVLEETRKISEKANLYLDSKIKINLLFEHFFK